MDRGHSWAAVAQGAVMKGLGMLTEKPAKVFECPRHYGVKKAVSDLTPRQNPGNPSPVQTNARLATNQIHWLVAKGDLVLPQTASTDNDDSTKKYDYEWTMDQDHFKAMENQITPFTVSEHYDLVFVASDEDMAPTLFENVSDSCLSPFCVVIKLLYLLK
jgi:hypothetical protein